MIRSLDQVIARACQIIVTVCLWRKGHTIATSTVSSLEIRLLFDITEVLLCLRYIDDQFHCDGNGTRKLLLLMK